MRGPVMWNRALFKHLGVVWDKYFIIALSISRDLCIMRTRGTRKKLGPSLTLLKFQTCCENGQAMLAPLRHIIPAEVRDLLIPGIKSKH